MFEVSTRAEHPDPKQGKTYVLMTSKCKHDDREAAQHRDHTCPLYDPDGPSVLHCIALDEVCDYENHEVPNGYQSNHTCIFERVQPP